MSWDAQEYAKSAGFEALVKIMTLIAILGGPLVVMDAVRPWIGKAAAVGLVVLPTVLLYIGAMALHDPDTDPSRRRSLQIGLVGVWILSLMNAYAVGQLVIGGISWTRINVLLGILVGTIATVLYSYAANRILREEDALRAGGV